MKASIFITFLLLFYPASSNEDAQTLGKESSDIVCARVIKLEVKPYIFDKDSKIKAEKIEATLIIGKILKGNRLVGDKISLIISDTIPPEKCDIHGFDLILNNTLRSPLNLEINKAYLLFLAKRDADIVTTHFYRSCYKITDDGSLINPVNDQKISSKELGKTCGVDLAPIGLK